MVLPCAVARPRRRAIALAAREPPPPPHWQYARHIRTAAAATIVRAPGEWTSCDDDRGWHLHAFDGLLFQIRLGKKVQQDAHGRAMVLVLSTLTTMKARG